MNQSTHSKGCIFRLFTVICPYITVINRYENIPIGGNMIKSQRFEMRLDPETLEQVDKWRAALSDLPSRAEAVRRLVNIGLGSTSTDVHLRDGEKLMLIMLRDLYKHHKIQGDIDPDFVAETINSGHHWGLGWRYPGIFDVSESNPNLVAEVVDILDMWHHIETGYENLSDQDKAEVSQEAAPFGQHVVFPGFDGNFETDHMSIAEYLVKFLGRFPRFKDRKMNSHLPTLDAYRRMLQAFQPMQCFLTAGSELFVSQIVELLKERMPPNMGRNQRGTDSR